MGEINLQPDTVMPIWMTAAYLELPEVVNKCNDFCQHSVTCISNQASDSDTNETSSVKVRHTHSWLFIVLRGLEVLTEVLL